MKPWKVILTDSALKDLDDILETTLATFGTAQLKRYTKLIQCAVRELEEAGPSAPLMKNRPDIRSGIATFPVARKGKAAPHHFYLSVENHTKGPSITILRILHERMDPSSHL